MGTTSGSLPHAHIRDGRLDPETLHLEHNLFQPVGRMAAPDCSCRTTDQPEIVRPG
jgi:hypothetical protein